jgi:hypothetical protein
MGFINVIEKKFASYLPFIVFSLAILFILGVRIISFNNNVLNHDEIEWLYGIHRMRIDPTPFIGFDAHTTGPLSIYILSLINFFVAQPQAIHLRLFCFFLMIVPSLALLFWGTKNYLNYMGLGFMTALLSINFNPFEYVVEDFFSYNTEFQILLFTAILHTILQGRLTQMRVFCFACLHVLFFFVKIQVLFILVYFGLAMLFKLIYHHNRNLLKLYVISVILLLTLILLYLLISGIFNEAFYIYIEKNILYQAHSLGKRVDLVTIIKSMLSTFYHQFRYLLISLGISFALLFFGLYQKRIKIPSLKFSRLNHPLFLSGGLFLVSIYTVVVSKNNFGHYYIMTFYPLSIFFSSLYRFLISQGISDEVKMAYKLGLCCCFIGAANVQYINRSYRFLFANQEERGNMKLGLPKGFNLDPRMKVWLEEHHSKDDQTILYLGWDASQMLYYEFGHTFEPVYRSANFYWYQSTFESGNQYFFQHEEANLMEDLIKKPPFYIVDCENLLGKVHNTKFTKFLQVHYVLVKSEPSFKIFQRLN